MPDCLNPPAVFDHLLGIAFSIALLWLVIGTLYRTVIWLRCRSDLSIVLTPAPTTTAGVLGRLFLEVIVFRALLRASPVTWLASLAMHYGLLWILLMHMRLLFQNLPLWMVPLLRFSGWAAALMAGGVLVLLLRRILVDRIRYVSSPSDYLHLLLLLALVVSGSLLKRIWPVDLYTVGTFIRGSLSMSWQALPEHNGLLLHLVLALILIFVFPLSKLVHGLGIVFSPTLVQKDHRAERR